MCVCVCFCVFVCDMCRQADTGQTLKKMFLGILIMNGLLYFSLALSHSLCLYVCVCVCVCVYVCVCVCARVAQGCAVICDPHVGVRCTFRLVRGKKLLM